MLPFHRTSGMFEDSGSGKYISWMLNEEAESDSAFRTPDSSSAHLFATRVTRFALKHPLSEVGMIGFGNSAYANKRQAAKTNSQNWNT